eukprot:gb/GECG01001504.1/.p1 GENE.gb/GECG01001504.1/~~gb/GECG01001504.1/.p1  ORF type:complete len:546 (+),score=63.97 gb/GECG01001504.1/:1-1638(+)
MAQEEKEPRRKVVANLNIGALGHVDCGKTSLVKLLSTELSTAALDKHPQSQERGITLDLGFSSFRLGILPEHWKKRYTERGWNSSDFPEDVQVTLVDCPGHASLIRSIIGGAQIIDMMLLVVDITKGIQTQTAECLVIGEIVTDHMIVVLNKVDLLAADEKDYKIEKMKKRVQKVLSKTKFHSAPIIVASARQEESRPAILEAIAVNSPVPSRDSTRPLLFNVDHCFSLKGKGTILTGTILAGRLNINDTIELPLQGEIRKVKSMQQFHQSIDSAQQGDRVGVCCSGLDASSIERAVACAPGYLRPVCSAVALVKKIKHYKAQVGTGSKFHISVGHATVLGTVSFFGEPFEVGPDASKFSSFSSRDPFEGILFDYSKEYPYRESLTEPDDDESGFSYFQWSYLRFESPVLIPRSGLLIGSKLDTDIRTKTCRIAFYGYAVENLEEKHPAVFREKRRLGKVDRVTKGGDGAASLTEIIGTGMFHKETDMSKFIGKHVFCEEANAELTIDNPFGKSGKFKCSTRAPCSLDKGYTLVLMLKKYITLSG